MNSTINTYLRKSTSSLRWKLHGVLQQKGPGCVVVIPAFAEYDFLFDALCALSTSSMDSLSQTQVVVVVNNRLNSTPDAIDNNKRSLDLLENLAVSDIISPMSIAWIDACTVGNEFSEKEGVGLARRIGADHGLRLLAETHSVESAIIHLDADTEPAPGYLDSVLRYYAEKPRWGGYASYQHPTAENTIEAQINLISYEIYMRYHELGLRYAGSPYAYPALGSIMSSTAVAYAAAGGMNRKCAGEDFYFMQQLRKTGTLDLIPNALVYPAGRISERTPFGTGRSISIGVNAEIPHAFLFHPECYEILRRFFALIGKSLLLEGKQILDATASIHPELKYFLKHKRFAVHWDNIVANHPSQNARMKQFHVWFDGLRTIQLIHHLRDTAFPNILAADALRTLYSWYDSSFDGENPLSHLRNLRKLCN